jgi:hypothetical protein
MRSNACSRCQGSMSVGFAFVATDYGNKVVNWVDGAPVKSMWGGLKLGKKPKHEIQTWRCARCGFLESYARG